MRSDAQEISDTREERFDNPAILYAGTILRITGIYRLGYYARASKSRIYANSAGTPPGWGVSVGLAAILTGSPWNPTSFDNALEARV
jgi:hypothetical protein